MTPFKLLMIATGLSIRETADYLNQSEAQIAKMCRTNSASPDGVRKPSPGTMAEMRALYAKQRQAANAIVQMLADIPAEAVVELGLASDDHEAQSLGWPSVGAQAGVFSMVVASSDRKFRIVPRGSTPATALAADIHGK